MSPAREAFVDALREFRALAQREAGQLEIDIVRTRDRGFPRFAADLAEWQIRLLHLVTLADGVTKEPGGGR